MRCTLIILCSLACASSLSRQRAASPAPGRGRRPTARRSTQEGADAAFAPPPAPAVPKGIDELNGFQLSRALDGAGLGLWRSAAPRHRQTSLSSLQMMLKNFDDLPKVLGLTEEAAIDAYRALLFGSFVVGAFLANGPAMDWLFPQEMPPMPPSTLAAPGPAEPVSVEAVRELRESMRRADWTFQARWLFSAAANSLPLGVGFLGLFQRDLLDEAILRARCAVDADFRRRVTFHECGHFLLAYLCGLPVATAQLKTGVELDLMAAIRADAAARGDDADAGGAGVGGGSGEDAWRRRVLQGASGVEVSARELGASAVDGGGVIGAAGMLGNAKLWPSGLLDAVCVVSMGGIMGEVVATGSARGGLQDVRSLEGLLNAAVDDERALREAQSEPDWEVRKQALKGIGARLDGERQDRVRWAALEALTLLRENEAALRRLVEACGVDAADGESPRWTPRAPWAPAVALPPAAACVAAIEALE